MTALLRILHITALSVAALGFGIGIWTWIGSHVSNGGIVAADLVNLGGLVIGLALGVALVWSAMRPAAMSARTVLLYASWLVVFAWYWFKRFSGSEVHSLDPANIESEQAKQRAISVGVFLLWVGLYLIGPVLKARRFRH